MKPAIIAALACLTSACVAPEDDSTEAPAAPAESKVFDFSPRSLDELAPRDPVALDDTATPKAQIIAMFATARHRIARCLTGSNHPAGTIQLAVTLALAPDDEPAITDVRVTAFDDVMLQSCLRAAVRAADPSMVVPPAAPERWVIDAPLVVEASYAVRL